MKVDVSIPTGSWSRTDNRDKGVHRMNPNAAPTRRRATHRRAVKVVAIAAVFVGTLGITHSASAGTATEADQRWPGSEQRPSPAVTIDQSTGCMAGATDAVAYRNDRIVLRTTATNPAVTATVNTTLNGMYGGNLNYVGPIERITFPTPPAGPPSSTSSPSP